MKNIKDKVMLNDGVEMPWFGLGVYLVQEGEEVYNSVRWALEAGYALVDTAAFYGNETGVGRAIHDSGVKREQVFLTTKLWNSDHGYESTLKAFEQSLLKLGTDYVDLYLIHWPGQDAKKRLATWEAMLKLKEQGKIRSAGVSNFRPHHIDELIKVFGTAPSVDQVELHPFHSQIPLRKYAREKGITVTAWGPIFHGHLNEVPEVFEIGKKYNKSGAQAVLRWHLQNGVAIIPKSIKKQRLLENADIFDFELSAEDMAFIDGLNKDKPFSSADPDTMTAGFR
jgi:diketogulonate reductase-like aldo/keto reductase